jgi:hypothetical protein
MLEAPSSVSKNVGNLAILIIGNALASGLISYLGLEKTLEPFLSADHLEGAMKPVLGGLSGFMSAVILAFVFLLFKIPFLRSLLDRKYKLAGRYLSLPDDDAARISIFDITPKFFSFADYSLEGVRFSIHQDEAEETGGWSSDRLQIKIDGNVCEIAYLYYGHAKDEYEAAPEGGKSVFLSLLKHGPESKPNNTKPFTGHGYSKVTLHGKDFEAGTGYWIDDDVVKRNKSHYFKLTAKDDRLQCLLEKKLDLRFWLRRCPGKPREIASAYAKLGANHPLHRRPATLPAAAAAQTKTA